MKLWLALNPITLLAYIDLQVKQKMNLRNLLKSLKLVWKIFNCKSPFLIILLGDVKARSKGWYKYNIKSLIDVDIEIFEDQYSKISF